MLETLLTNFDSRVCHLAHPLRLPLSTTSLYFTVEITGTIKLDLKVERKTILFFASLARPSLRKLDVWFWLMSPSLMDVLSRSTIFLSLDRHPFNRHRGK